MQDILLTKTLLMKGFQCPKQLYLHLKNPELASADKNLKIKEEGNKVGVLAQDIFPTGVLVQSKNPLLALDETSKKINHKILFEAAFRFENLYFRADVFEQTEDGINIIEVKSSTEVKGYQVQDLSIQALILKKLGYKINKLYICHINRSYDLSMPLSDLFILSDETETVIGMLTETENKIENIKNLIKSNPVVKIGPHCTSPFECPFKRHCFSKVTADKDSILNFPHLKQKWDLFNSGKIRVQDLNDSDLKSEGQKLALKKFKAGKEFIDHAGIRADISNWSYPLYFLDFETVDTVYPKYPKTKPNTKITYQFSLFKLDLVESDPTLIKAYLAESLDTDPRHELGRALVEGLKGSGSIVSYNASFERGRVEELAQLIPELKQDLLDIKSRIVDLLPVMRDHVFNRDFNWSWSIKSVIPALFGEAASYKNLSVSNGLDAQALYLKSLKDNNLSENKDFLIEYCNKDVEEMIRLYKFLIDKLYEIDFSSS